MKRLVGPTLAVLVGLGMAGALWAGQNQGTVRASKTIVVADSLEATSAMITVNTPGMNIQTYVRYWRTWAVDLDTNLAEDSVVIRMQHSPNNSDWRTYDSIVIAALSVDSTYALTSTIKTDSQIIWPWVRFQFALQDSLDLDEADDTLLVGNTYNWVFKYYLSGFDK